MKPSLIFLIVVLALSSSIQAQVKVEDAKFVESANGRTIILGTYIWDAETDSFPPFGKAEGKKGDIWLQQINKDRDNLVPRNGAVLAKIPDKKFDEIIAEDLKNLAYSKTPVSNEILTEGALFALRTGDGNYAKLKIVGYRALHDFSFKEASILRDGWKRWVLTKENKEKYHLEVEWVLYTKQ